MALRFELSGTMAPSGPPGPGNPSNPPIAILTYTPDTIDKTLDVNHYRDLGYTAFDVICIGAGGGQGGGIDAMKGMASYSYPGSSGTTKAPGGAGGGGGIQKISGLLSALPDTVNIEIGSGGNPGTDDVSDPTLTTDGSDGGYSTFNGTACQASGGKAGHRAQDVYGSTNAVLHSDGGDGGLGGTIVAGGGGAGGIARGEPSGLPVVAQTDATPGSWNPTTGIGGGGGGGAGGLGTYFGGNATTGGVTMRAQFWGTSGAGGAFDPTDTSVYSPGSTASSVNTGYSSPDPGAIAPGYGGGAKAAPLNGLSTTFGDSDVGISKTNNWGGNVGYTPPKKGHDGAVIVLLRAN